MVFVAIVDICACHVLLQVQLSLLSFGPEQQQLLEVAKESGVTVIAYSPLALGLLSGAAHNNLLARPECAAPTLLIVRLAS
jgi:aryl-alcohol dehydrogenase-like predicted oxidoreductase